MDSFWIYLQLGFEHILDVQGADHMLFVVSLCSVFRLVEWKKMLLLVSAFTLGHSFSLSLSVLNYVLISSYLIEVIIPITILLTACLNIWYANKAYRLDKLYWLPAAFGIVHGLGFSNYLKSLLGVHDDIVASLFAFNLGIEFGQILIVLCFIIPLELILRIKKIKRTIVIRVINLMIALISLMYIYRAI